MSVRMNDTKPILLEDVAVIKCEIKEEEVFESTDEKCWPATKVKREIVTVKSESEVDKPDKSKKEKTAKNRRSRNTQIKNCPKCDKQFLGSRMKSHIATTHPIRKDHVCVLCSKGFDEGNDLQRHTDEVHLKMRNYICSICSKAFTKEMYLRKHIDVVHYKIKNVYCTVCKDGRFCANPSHYKNAPDVSHKPFACNMCGTKFLRREGLRWHTKKAHKLLYYKCDVCPETRFIYKRELKAHFLSAHDDVKTKLTCKECGKEFSRTFNLRLHMRGVHENAKSYACANCDKAYTYRSNLKDHILKWHKP